MKLFVWDLHGTLEKGTEYASFEITNRILEEENANQKFEFGFFYQHVYGKRIRNFFTEMLPGKSRKYYENLEQRFLHIANTEFEAIIKPKLQRNSYATEVLKAIQSKGHEQILLSNVTEENLEKFIEALSLDGFFPKEKRFATTNGEGTNPKVTIFQEIIEERKRREDCIFIGDRPEDLEPVYISGGYTFLYAHPERPFVVSKGDIQPDEKINDLREVLKRI